MTPSRADQRRATGTDRPPGRARAATSGPRGRLVFAVGAAGLVLGALVGGLLGSLREPEWTATALVQVDPDPVVSPAGSSTSSLSDSQLSAFLQTQLIYLGSSGFSQQVQQEVGGASIDLATTQVQEAPVVQVVARDPSRERASAVVQQAVQDYTDYRTTKLQQSLDSQASATQEQLDQTATALDQLPVPDRDDQTSAVALQRQAVQTQYTSLLAQNSAIAAARQAAAGVVTSLQAVETTAPAGLPPALTGALAGAALAVLAAVGAVVLLWRLSSRITGTVDLERYGVAVLAPEVPFARSTDDVVDGPVQRTVAAQSPHLEGGRGGAPELALVGPASGVGTSFLALQHAVYAARRGPVVLVRAVGDDAGDSELLRPLGVAAGASAVDAGGERTSAADLERWAVSTAVPDLYLITFGPSTGTGTALLESALEAGLAEACRAVAWGLVVDAPALDRSTAGLLAARAVGACALVVAAGSTSRTEVEQALDAFAAWRQSPTAFVVNRPARSTHRTAPDLVPHGTQLAPVTAGRAGRR